MVDYNDNEEFWVEVYDWVAEWFHTYENAGFTPRSIYDALIKQMITEGDEIPTFEQFTDNFL